MAMAQDTQIFESSWPGNEAHNLQVDELALGVEAPLLSSQPVDTWGSTLCRQDSVLPGAGEQNDLEYLFDFAEACPSPTTMDLAARAPLEFSAPRCFDVAALTNEIESKLQYAIDRIKAAPRTMLLETETPWCHPLLYREQMPRVMQDAISSCALYVAKNPINAPVVMSCINARVNDLLDSTLPESPLDTLARTQAILLYQIIRFFDGDILARASADATFNELESAVSDLLRHISWAGEGVLSNLEITGKDIVDLPMFPLQPSRESWREWIFQESARRTYLIASFFIRAWKMLTGRPLPGCREDLPLMHEQWTLSAYLWQARDAYAFSLAWRERKHFVVTRRTVMSTLAGAGHDDLEPFGKMLLTVALGIDEAKAWLKMKGAVL
ncbi:hypothetical protein VMCG_07632 [Cytospora schulzeri]|uniref:Transcription factor domain-containing protein n=1 Tax=Cytospora schulzeri TaxID=448051 RepID=A0A423VXD3_9PEZI|nr:hypothetical protein VMCG_07632 [Valsa malicola]